MESIHYWELFSVKYFLFVASNRSDLNQGLRIRFFYVCGQEIFEEIVFYVHRFNFSWNKYLI